MGVVYSNFSNKHINLDYDEVFELTNGDFISLNDTKSLLDAYYEGFISAYDMINELSFDEEDLI